MIWHHPANDYQFLKLVRSSPTEFSFRFSTEINFLIEDYQDGLFQDYVKAISSNFDKLLTYDRKVRETWKAGDQEEKIKLVISVKFAEFENSYSKINELIHHWYKADLEDTFTAGREFSGNVEAAEAALAHYTIRLLKTTYTYPNLGPIMY